MHDPLVSCLCATHGRYKVLCDALTCFIEQDYPNKELIILNNHPTPLKVDLPQVKIYNEPKYPTLGDCRIRMLELAKGDFIRTWDDDDLYLSHCISQGVDYIPEGAVAWKPARSWSWHKDKKTLGLNGNYYEAAWTCRTQFVKMAGYLAASSGNEHKPLKDALAKGGGIARDEIGVNASYVYTWGTGLHHASQTLGGTLTINERSEKWKGYNQDSGDENNNELVLTDLNKYWDKIETAKQRELSNGLD